MGLLDRLKGRPPRDPETEARENARREQSLRNLKEGGLPVTAIERLNEQRSRQGTEKHFFTSNLSANEFGLIATEGYSPLGQVMGSSVYHVGFGWVRGMSGSSTFGGGASYELAALTDAVRNARSLALTRLKQEASLLGATGVVGVRLTQKEHEWGPELLEYAAIGTAIRETNLPTPRQDGPDHQVFLSDLSGQDFWTLRRAGFRPVGIAAGNCAYYQIPTWTTQRAMGGGMFSSWQNQELHDYTQALYQARELAMERLTQAAIATGGTGIVGVTTEIKADPQHIEVPGGGHRTDMIYHFSATGTVIAPAGAMRDLDIAPTVSLQDNASIAQP